MAKRGPRTDLEQAIRCRRARGGEADTEPPRRTPEQPRVTRRLGRRDKHQALRLVGQRLEPSPKHLFETSAEGQCIEQPEATGEFGRSQRAR